MEIKLRVQIPHIDKMANVAIKEGTTFRSLKKFLCENYNIEYDNTFLFFKGNELDESNVIDPNLSFKDKIFLNVRNTSNSNKQIPLQIVFTDSQQCTLQVLMNDKWSDVKRQLQDLYQEPAVHFSLFYKNCQLQDHLTIAESDVFSSSKIFVSRNHDDSILDKTITDQFRFTCRFCHKVGAGIRYRYSCSACSDEGVQVENRIELGKSKFRDLLCVKGRCGIKTCRNYNKLCSCDVALYCKDCPTELRLNSNRMYVIHGGSDTQSLIYTINDICGYDYKFYFANCNSIADISK